MKINFSSPRGASLLIVAAFGLLVSVLTVTAVRFARDISLVKQSDNLRNDLKIIAFDISEHLSGNDDALSFDVFDEKLAGYFTFIETTARVHKDDEHFSYVVRNKDGIVLSPAFAAGKPLDIKNIRYTDADSVGFLADVWDCPCFVVAYEFSDHPLEILGIYDNKFIFNDVNVTIDTFLYLFGGVFLLMLLVSWLWIIPSLEKMYRRRNLAEQELKTAHELQQKAVTNVFPSDPRFDIAAVLRPAKEVGGDIYRIRLDGDKLYFLIGDVSDKGTAAAFVMFLLSSFIHSRMKSGISLSGLMDEANALLADNQSYEMFCTLFMAVIDLNTLEMEYCNAGHEKCLAGSDYIDQDPQLIVGIDRNFKFHTQKMQLNKGMRLLVYTDGVTEARAEDRSFFGGQRLKEWMARKDAGCSCREVCDDLLVALSDFRGRAEQSDDIAIMCIKI